MLALPGASAHKLKVEEENESAEYFWWHMSHLRMAPLEDNPPPRVHAVRWDDNDFTIMESEKEMREEGWRCGRRIFIIPTWAWAWFVVIGWHNQWPESSGYNLFDYALFAAAWCVMGPETKVRFAASFSCDQARIGVFWLRFAAAWFVYGILVFV